MINHDSSVPKYIQLAELLEKEIYDGKYNGAERFFSENELCRQYKVSRITVRQALGILESKDLIFTVHGKGTFVKIPVLSQSLPKLSSFSETLSHKGLNGYTKIKSYNSEIKNKKAVDILNCARFGEICNLNLIGFAQKTPVVYYQSYIREKIGENMYQLSLEMEKKEIPFSTYDIYSQLHIELDRVEQNISAINLGKDLAEIFELKPGKALIVLESIYYNKEQIPIEYKTGYYRSDIYSFNLKREL